MSDEKKFFESMESDILNANIPEEEKSKLMKNLLNLKKQKINLMITGATGVGKSSTINALFNTEKAKVGVGTWTTLSSGTVRALEMARRQTTAMPRTSRTSSMKRMRTETF